jgi:cell division protein FtsB
MTTDNTAATAAMTAGRRADTARRRQRVTVALTEAAERGDELTAAAIARRAGVDRSFLYRHADLLEQLHAAQAQPPTTAAGTTVSRASLQADLLAAQQRNVRLAARIQQLETRLSQLLGEHTWRSSGLGAPEDIDHLKQRIVMLEQQVIDLQLQLDEREQDLDAARATNRALMAQLNATACACSPPAS